MPNAVYAGSFDPVTNGHLWMIEEGAKLFRKLTVAIGVNPDKKPTFSLEQRCQFIESSIGHLENVSVDTFHNRYLVDYAKSIDAGFILRGIRSGADYEYERVMRHVNEDLSPSITTVFLMPPRTIAEVSSSLVMSMVGPKGWAKTVERFVAPSVFKALKDKYGDD